MNRLYSLSGDTACTTPKNNRIIITQKSKSYAQKNLHH